jgi:hypothetical protein
MNMAKVPARRASAAVRGKPKPASWFHRSRRCARAEVPADAKPSILRRHLEVAPAARLHVPVDRRAPLQEFEQIAARIPVFRIAARL